MAKEDFHLSMPLRVRWAEVDPQSIVFNAHYLTYCDICSTEYWRAIGVRYPEDLLRAHGVDIFVVKSTLEYHASARFTRCSIFAAAWRGWAGRAWCSAWKCIAATST